MNKLTKIDTIEELNNNLKKVEAYLNFDEGKEMRKEMIRLIERGKNFIAYQIGNEIHFAPSRFVGYKNNNIAVHLESREKHGTTTSNNLRKKSLLGQDNTDDKLCRLYIEYCKTLNPNSNVVEYPNKPQTFWMYNIDYFEDEIETYDGFPEGKESEILHKRKERSSKLIALAKCIYIKKSKCKCQICGFDFYETYGVLGQNYIEAHHIIPVSELNKEGKTRIENIAFVCSNCHSMLHRKRPWLSINELNNLINS